MPPFCLSRTLEVITIPSTYTTVSDDRWDWIAKKTLGSELYVTQLVAANPDHLQYYAFPAGIVLQIPDIPRGTAAQLPPWRTENE